MVRIVWATERMLKMAVQRSQGRSMSGFLLKAPITRRRLKMRLTAKMKIKTPKAIGTSKNKNRIF